VLDKDKYKNKVVDSGMFPEDSIEKIYSDIDDYADKIKTYTDDLVEDEKIKIEKLNKELIISEKQEITLISKTHNDILNMCLLNNLIINFEI